VSGRTGNRNKDGVLPLCPRVGYGGSAHGSELCGGLVAPSDDRWCSRDSIQRVLSWSVSKLTGTVALGWAQFSCTVFFQLNKTTKILKFKMNVFLSSNLVQTLHGSIFECYEQLCQLAQF
jgi:hypothetical protein